MSQAGPRHQALQQVMRGFGRQGRGQGNVVVKRGRPSATPWCELGHPIGKRAQSVQPGLQEASHRRETTRERWASPRRVAMTAPPPSRTPSHRWPPGTRRPQGTIVQADEPTLAPSGTGQSQCPTPWGRTPGLLSGPAAGVVVAVQLPVGHPSDASAVGPLVDQVEPAMARVTSRPQLALHAVAGERGGNAPQVHPTLHARGLLPIGMAQTVEPMTPEPTPEAGLALLQEAGWHRTRTPHQVRLACACGDSRPVGARHMASLLARGAGQLRDNGPQGAVVQLGMTVMAHHGATLVRIRQPRLSKRAQQFRRWLG